METIGQIYTYADTTIEDHVNMNIVKRKLYSLIFRFIYYIDFDIEGDRIYDLTHEDPRNINIYNDIIHKCSTTKKGDQFL